MILLGLPLFVKSWFCFEIKGIAALLPRLRDWLIPLTIGVVLWLLWSGLCLATAASFPTPLERAQEIRRDLQAQHLYDDNREDWQAVLDAISEGCAQFTAAPSRLACQRKCEGWSADPRQRLLYRVLPVREWRDGQAIPWVR
jgi:hypothetical protein